MIRARITRWVPLGIGVGTLLAAGLSVLGWIFGIPRLIDWVGDGITIKANASICLTISAICLILMSARRPRKGIVRVLASIVALTAAATIFQHLTYIDLGIDQLLFTEGPGARSTAAPGRMGLPASISLVGIGAAFILSTLGSKLRSSAVALSLTVLGIVSLSLVGYLFGADQLYSVPKYTGIALQTATMIAALGIGISSLIPERGLVAAFNREDTGGVVFRQLVVPGIAASLLMGFLRVRGQQIGLFDLEFGTATRTVVEIVLLLFLLWRTTKVISISENEVRMISRMPLENPSPVIRFTGGGDVVFANPAWQSVGIDPENEDDPTVMELKGLARESFAYNRRITKEMRLGESTFAVTLAPIVEDGFVNLYANDITEREQSAKLLERRARELAGLYDLSDRSNRSQDLQAIYESALEAITKGLDCSRGAILLLDDHGKMVFVASKGLSKEYQAAVAGHSPWSQNTGDAKPIGISDVQNSDLPRDKKAAVEREGISSLAFVPLITHEVLIGKFMVYYDNVHEFTDPELDLAMTIGHQIAFAVERQRIEAKRRETERELRENDERLRLAAQAGKVGIWDWNVDAGTVSWSDSLYAMHGVTRNDYDGTAEGVARLIHEDDRDTVSERLQQALSEANPYEIEFRVQRPDGSVIWLYTSAVVVKDPAGKPYRMIGATVDITGRKTAELESAKLAAIVEWSGDAIISKDCYGIVTSWNRGAETMFGYPSEEIIGKNIKLVIPEDRLHEEDNILETVCSGAPIEPYDTTRRRKDGSFIEVSISVSPLFNPDGDVIGASKIARDVTHQRAAAAAVRESEIMHRIVAAQEAERNRIARDLHDHLGQQLTALRLKLESIRRKSPPSGDLLAEVDATRELASRIDIDLNFMSWELRPTELDHLGLTDALTSFVREWSMNHGIQASFHGGKMLDKRFSTETETNIYRIVQEGLNNILKHARARNVDILLELREDQAVLIIEDDGVGFSIDSGPSRAEGPGGLGLIGMRERAALLGGTLEIESRPGEGTSVFARIPVSPNGSNGKV